MFLATNHTFRTCKLRAHLPVLPSWLLLSAVNQLKRVLMGTCLVRGQWLLWSVIGGRRSAAVIDYLVVSVTNGTIGNYSSCLSLWWDLKVTCSGSFGQLSNRGDMFNGKLTESEDGWKIKWFPDIVIRSSSWTTLKYTEYNILTCHNNLILMTKNCRKLSHKIYFSALKEEAKRKAVQ